jgi:predicted transcriptional regulator of viral defense system
MKKVLGNLERQLFSYTQLRGLRTLKTGDLTKILQINSIQERKLFDRLNGDKMITQVRRGLYLIPQKLPLGGKWSPTDILAINTLVEDQKGKYQICGPNAFNRYGFDEQIPTRMYVYNNRLSEERTIGSIAITLIKVNDNRLGDIEEVKTREGEIGLYSSRRRSLLDAVYDWSRFNTLPRAYQWIEKEIADKSVLPKDLVEVTLRYADVGTMRRIGFVLDKLGVQKTLLAKFQKVLKPSSSFIPLIPSLPKRGSIDRQWGVLINGEW